MDSAKLAVAQTLMMAAAFQNMQKEMWVNEKGNQTGFYKPCLSNKIRNKRRKNKNKRK